MNIENTPIITRSDGSFVVQHNGSPYHVVSKDLDPFNAFDLDEVRTFAEKYPEEVIQGGPSLSQIKADLCARIESRKDAVMRAGFDYYGSRMQGDSEAQANLMAWVLIDARGALSYPRQWRRSDNTFLDLASSPDLMALAGAMADFKDRVYSGIFTAKDGIRMAEDMATAQSIFDDWSRRFDGGSL